MKKALLLFAALLVAGLCGLFAGCGARARGARSRE